MTTAAPQVGIFVLAEEHVINLDTPLGGKVAIPGFNSESACLDWLETWCEENPDTPFQFTLETRDQHPGYRRLLAID